MEKKVARIALTGLFLLVLMAPTAGVAQEDNTGTNPANFTNDFRLIAEVAEFEAGGGSLITNTAELRWPLGRNIANIRGEGPGSLFYDMGTKLQFRIRARYQSLSVNDPNGSGATSEVSGIGNFDARLLGIAYTSKKLIIAAGLEGFFDTASNDVFRTGTTSLGPQVFAIFPGVLGGRSLFAPGYQYVFDVAGDGPDVSRSQLDLYLVWLLAQGKNWLILDPQAVVDHENDIELGSFEAEWGFMIAPSVGASGYLRPGIGIGAHKPYSWNLEVGLKFVWR